MQPANTMHRFRMNWGAGGRRIESGDDHSIFVGDLAPDVTDDLLLSTFSSRFSSVRGAKVVIDPVTRMSKGFGFVRFGMKEEAEQALQTMNGVYCSSRPMRVSVATDRNGKPRGSQGSYGSGMGGGMGNTEEEGANTTVFVGGLDASTTEEELRSRFGAIGDVRSLRDFVAHLVREMVLKVSYMLCYADCVGESPARKRLRFCAVHHEGSGRSRDRSDERNRDWQCQSALRVGPICCCSCCRGVGWCQRLLPAVPKLPTSWLPGKFVVVAGVFLVRGTDCRLFLSVLELLRIPRLLPTVPARRRLYWRIRWICWLRAAGIPTARWIPAPRRSRPPRR